MVIKGYEIMGKAIKTYGDNAQLDMCIEEMSELIKEICKKKRGGNNREKIIEEIADVNIMIEQLKIMCDIKKEDVDYYIKQKLARLDERLNENVRLVNKVMAKKDTYFENGDKEKFLTKDKEYEVIDKTEQSFYILDDEENIHKFSFNSFDEWFKKVI